MISICSACVISYGLAYATETWAIRLFGVAKCMHGYDTIAEKRLGKAEETHDSWHWSVLMLLCLKATV